MITKEESVVSEEAVRAELQKLRSIGRGASQERIDKAFAALNLLWFAWETSLSERQAIEVLLFFGKRSPETVAMLKKTFVEWLNGLSE